MVWGASWHGSHPVSLESIETELTNTNITRMMLLSGMTMLIYDHLLTLPTEISLIWTQRFGMVTSIFLLNRYLVPLVLVTDIFEYFGLGLIGEQAEKFCHLWPFIQAALTIISFMSIHALVALRVDALHGGRKGVRRLLIISGIIYVISCVGIAVVAVLPFSTSTKLHRAYDHSTNMCFITIPSWLWTIWLPTLIFETLLFVLTAQAAMKAYKRSYGSLHSPLYLILYRDGLVYFLVVSVCTTFSLIVWLIAPPTLLGLARFWSLAMVNVCSSRMVLNLRDYAAAVAASTGTGMPTSINPSAAAIVGSSTTNRSGSNTGGINNLRQSWSIWDGSKGDAQLIEMQKRFGRGPAAATSPLAAGQGQGPALTTPPPRRSSRRLSNNNRVSRTGAGATVYPRPPRPPPVPPLPSLPPNEASGMAGADGSYPDHPYATTTYWQHTFDQV